MKTKNILLILLCIGFTAPSIIAQTSVKPKASKRSLTITLNSNFHWYTSEGFKGNLIDQYNINADFKINKYLGLMATHRTQILKGDVKNQLLNAHMYFRNNAAPKPNAILFKHGGSIEMKVGAIAWMPTFTNTQLIVENVDKFINPDMVYGATYVTTRPLIKDHSLNLNFAGHTGDLINNKLKAKVMNANLNYTKLFKYKLGVSVQAGISQGSQHLVNFAHFLYTPKFENIQAVVKLGKLPSNDASPYGLHISFVRNFKNVAIGGFYERRLNQKTVGQIAGVSWKIIGPAKLAKFMNTFNAFYDFNTNTVWMWVPLFKMNINYK